MAGVDQKPVRDVSCSKCLQLQDGLVCVAFPHRLIHGLFYSTRASLLAVPAMSDKSLVITWVSKS